MRPVKPVTMFRPAAAMMAMKIRLSTSSQYVPVKKGIASRTASRAASSQRGSGDSKIAMSSA